MSVQQAAKKFGVSLPAIYAWEKGQYLPRGERLLQIALSYGCTVEELMDEARPRRKGGDEG